MQKLLAVFGDPTTTGGKVISASNRSFSHGQGIACQGDYATCPKCTKRMGPIIEGTYNYTVDGKPAAYDGCIVACGCPMGHNRIIATKSYVIVGISNDSITKISNSSKLNVLRTTFRTYHNVVKPFSNSIVDSNRENSNIRLDAQRLMECAHELCEKHLYYDEVKQSFIKEVDNFAMDIVDKVENGVVSYDEGSNAIQTEKQSLLEQSWEWIKKGLAVLGAIMLAGSGLALCATGPGGIIIGVYMMAHATSNLQEVVTGEDGFMKSAYQNVAQALGMSKYVGSLAYDFVDLGISVHGKLKLEPKLDKTLKINEFNPVNKEVFKLYYYGVQDLQRAFKRMSGKWLTVEIVSDAISLTDIVDEAKNIFFKNKETDEPALYIPQPENINNVGEIIHSCNFVMADNSDPNKSSGYYKCITPDGSTYPIYSDENNEEVNE